MRVLLAVAFICFSLSVDAGPCRDLFSFSGDDFGPLDIIGVTEVFLDTEGRKPTSDELIQLEFIHRYGENLPGRIKGTNAETFNFTPAQIKDKYRSARGVGREKRTQEFKDAAEIAGLNFGLSLHPQTVKTLMRKSYLGGKSKKNKKKNNETKQKKDRAKKLREARNEKKAKSSPGTLRKSTPSISHADALPFYTKFHKLLPPFQELAVKKIDSTMEAVNKYNRKTASFFDPTERISVDLYLLVLLQAQRNAIDSEEINEGSTHLPKSVLTDLNSVETKDLILLGGKDSIEEQATIFLAKALQLLAVERHTASLKNITPDIDGESDSMPPPVAGDMENAKSGKYDLSKNFSWIKEFAFAHKDQISWELALENVYILSKGVNFYYMYDLASLVLSLKLKPQNFLLKILDREGDSVTQWHKLAAVLVSFQHPKVQKKYQDKISKWYEEGYEGFVREPKTIKIYDYLLGDKGVALNELFDPTAIRELKNSVYSYPKKFVTKPEYFDLILDHHMYDLVFHWVDYHRSVESAELLPGIDKILDTSHLLAASMQSVDLVLRENSKKIIRYLHDFVPSTLYHPAWQEVMRSMPVAEVPEFLQPIYFNILGPKSAVVELLSGVNQDIIPHANRVKVAEILETKILWNSFSKDSLQNEVLFDLVSAIESNKVADLNITFLRIAGAYGIHHEALLSAILRNVKVESHLETLQFYAERVSSYEAASIIDSYRGTTSFSDAYKIFGDRLSPQDFADIFMRMYEQREVFLSDTYWSSRAVHADSVPHLLDIIRTRGLDDDLMFELADAIERANLFPEHYRGLRSNLKLERAERKKQRLKEYADAKKDTPFKQSQLPKDQLGEFGEDARADTVEFKSSTDRAISLLRKANQTDGLGDQDKAIESLRSLTSEDIAEMPEVEKAEFWRAVTSSVRIFRKSRHLLELYEWTVGAIMEGTPAKEIEGAAGYWFEPIAAALKKTMDRRPYVEGLARLQRHLDPRIASLAAEQLDVLVKSDVTGVISDLTSPRYTKKLFELMLGSNSVADRAVYAAELLPFIHSKSSEVARVARIVLNNATDLSPYVVEKITRRMTELEERLSEGTLPQLTTESIASAAIWSGLETGSHFEMSQRTNKLFNRFFERENAAIREHSLKRILEAAGMDTIIRRVLSNGNIPIDMSKTHAGFDVLSVDFTSGKLLCLEAKAKLMGSDHFDRIDLTHHELRTSNWLTLRENADVAYQIEIIDVFVGTIDSSHISAIHTLKNVQIYPHTSSEILPGTMGPLSAKYARNKLIESFGSEPKKHQISK